MSSTKAPLTGPSENPDLQLLLAAVEGRDFHRAVVTALEVAATKMDLGYFVRPMLTMGRGLLDLEQERTKKHLLDSTMPV